MYSLPSANGVGADEAGEVQQAVIALQKQGIAKKEIEELRPYKAKVDASGPEAYVWLACWPRCN